MLWKQKFLYYLPVHDQLPLSSVKLVMKSDSQKSQVNKTLTVCLLFLIVLWLFVLLLQILVGSKSYGTMGPGGLLQVCA